MVGNAPVLHAILIHVCLWHLDGPGPGSSSQEPRNRKRDQRPPSLDGWSPRKESPRQRTPSLPERTLVKMVRCRGKAPDVGAGEAGGLQRSRRGLRLPLLCSAMRVGPRRPSLHMSSVIPIAAVAEVVRHQAEAGQEGQAEPAHRALVPLQDRYQDQVRGLASHWMTLGVSLEIDCCPRLRPRGAGTSDGRRRDLTLHPIICAQVQREAEALAPHQARHLSCCRLSTSCMAVA